MAKHSKRYNAYKSQIDTKKTYSIDEALKIIASSPKAKFDESVEVHMLLGIDPRKGDQLVRGTVVLPHGTGKTKKVAVFCGPEQEEAAKKAGADIVGGEELINDIKTSETCNFDVAVATPSMMKALAPIARILGQKGLMPNPKVGTVVDDVSTVVKELKAGKISFKNDNTANLHQIIGKLSFGDQKLKENLAVFVEEVKKLKPEGQKGVYMKSITLASTMGPGLTISLS